MASRRIRPVKRGPRKMLKLGMLALALLLGGAIVNVAVAWLAQLREPRVKMVAIANWNCGEDKFTSTVGRGSFTLTVWHVPLGKPFSEAFLVGLRGSKAPPIIQQASLPNWTSTDCTDQSINWNDVIEVRAAGWPRLGLCCTVGSGRFSQPPTLIAGISLPAEAISTPFGTIFRRRALPCYPIWPGFAINTIFYAAILWGMSAVPLALRRRRRLKRGLCPACAYPIGASPVCTECGASVTPVSKGMTT
jgi:hypothetical protein